MGFVWMKINHWISSTRKLIRIMFPSQIENTNFGILAGHPNHVQQKLYNPENQDDIGKSQFWIGNTSSNGGFSIVVLFFWGVYLQSWPICQQHQHLCWPMFGKLRKHTDTKLTKHHQTLGKYNLNWYEQTNISTSSSLAVRFWCFSVTASIVTWHEASFLTHVFSLSEIDVVTHIPFLP